MIGQLAALLHLRYILFRNQWLRSVTGVFSSVIAGIVLLAFAGLGFALMVGLFFLGASGFHHDNSITLLIACDAMIVFFLIFWVSGVTMELQRSDLIDMRKLLYLPVSLWMVYGLNFASSLFTPAAILFLLPASGFILGLVVADGAHMLFAFVPLLLFLIALAAWTFFVRGWLATVMENKRKRRLILTIVPIVFVLIAQGPFLATQFFMHSSEPGAGERFLADYADRAGREVMRGGLLEVNEWLPLAWFPLSVYTLSEERHGIAAASTGGLAVMALVGLAFGYRNTKNYYEGKTRATARPVDKSHHSTARRTGNAVERRVPFADGDTAALVWATFLNYIRMPAIRMMLIGPLVLGAVFLIFSRSGPQHVQAGFAQAANMVAIGVIVWPHVMLMSWYLNIFGADRESFSAFILAPAPRYKFLLAKNLVLIAMTAGIVGLLLGFAAIAVPFRVTSIVTAMAQCIQLSLCCAILGNMVSIYFPFRINPGAMRTNTSLKNSIPALLTMLSMPFLVAPTALALALDPVIDAVYPIRYVSPGLIASLFFLSLTLVLYRLSLPLAGRMLQQREHTVFEKLVHGRE